MQGGGLYIDDDYGDSDSDDDGKEKSGEEEEEWGITNKNEIVSKSQ